MRLLLQRVSRAAVRVGEDTVGAIGPGMLVFVGVGTGDDREVADTMARRTAELRMFADDAGKTNRSLLETGGSALVVSQFTLQADTSRGRRPGFSAAAPGPLADELYRRYAASLRQAGVADVQLGRFGAVMAVELVNDGPFTIWLDSEAPERLGRAGDANSARSASASG